MRVGFGGHHLAQGGAAGGHGQDVGEEGATGGDLLVGVLGIRSLENVGELGAHAVGPDRDAAAYELPERDEVGLERPNRREPPEPHMAVCVSSRRRRVPASLVRRRNSSW